MGGEIQNTAIESRIQLAGGKVFQLSGLCCGTLSFESPLFPPGKVPVCLALLFTVLLVSGGCVTKGLSQTPSHQWTTGFWFWHDNNIKPAAASFVTDVLYVHAGRFGKYGGPATQQDWYMWDGLPDKLPAANQYWLVFRYEQQGVPDAAVLPKLERSIGRMIASARQRGLAVAGIQLDIDSPTNQLEKYAEFLRELRKGFPAQTAISITALLDWFTDGTSIGDVISETEEFVPQFYDLGPASLSSRGQRPIAAKIDAQKWAPRFNRFGKRYRIGISTFGRANSQSVSGIAEGYSGSRFYRDLTPLDLAANPAFSVNASRNDIGELSLSFRATQEVSLGFHKFSSGDAIGFTLATPEAVRAAVANARGMGGNCAGVVFFRWPSAQEVMVLSPDEVMAAMGLLQPEQHKSSVEFIDGHCAAVSCVDLYLTNVPAYSATPSRYRLRSSVTLEYFLPEKTLPVRVTGPSELEVTIPPYGGQSKLLTGRAVTAVQSRFSVENLP
jgi:hypothetical protein